MIDSGTLPVLGTAAGYFLLLLGIGEYAGRRTTDDREDYLMASRSFGTVVLFFALLATNMTSFVLLGAPGLAYQAGIGTLGYIVGLSTLILPLLFATVGYRLWRAGEAFGHLTPGQFFNHRLNATHLGAFIMGLMTFWTVPYLLLAAIGSGIAFDILTNGSIPYWLGAALPLVIVFVYVFSGGMRATGWTNVFQGIVFILFLWGLLALLVIRLGGATAATDATAATRPGHLTRAGPPQFSARMWLSFGLMISINAMMYPHMFRRILVALNEQTLRRVVILYPVGLLCTWVPAVFIGFWGAGQIPGLTGPDVDTILPLLVLEFTPPVIGGIALAGILAAIMSSLDAQTLSVSTMFSQDLLRTYTTPSEQQEVWSSRLLVGVILAITFVLALLRPDTIVGIAEFAFSGYALLFFPLVVSLYWRRATAAGAWAGLLWGFVGLLAFEFGVLPAALTGGFLPFFPLFITQIIVTLIIGALTTPPPADRVDAYFTRFEDIW